MKYRYSNAASSYKGFATWLSHTVPLSRGLAHGPPAFLLLLYSSSRTRKKEPDPFYSFSKRPWRLFFFKLTLSSVYICAVHKASGEVRNTIAQDSDTPCWLPCLLEWNQEGGARVWARTLGLPTVVKVHACNIASEQVARQGETSGRQVVKEKRYKGGWLRRKWCPVKVRE